MDGYGLLSLKSHGGCGDQHGHMRIVIVFLSDSCSCKEVTGTFDKLQQQMASLRVLAADEDPSIGGKHATASPLRNSRSKSVATGQLLPEADTGSSQPAQRKRQVKLLLDQWYRRMEEDLGELMDAVREVSTTVGTVRLAYILASAACDMTSCHSRGSTRSVRQACVQGPLKPHGRRE